MKINVVSISKPKQDSYQTICEHFIKLSKRFASINSYELFNSKINRAQERSEKEAKLSYSEAFKKWQKRGYLVALDPLGEALDSSGFSSLLDTKSEVTFFIGGAYGHDREFLNYCDRIVSLSKLTLSHKVAKVVLFEQIYRSLSILNSHPYHK